MINKLMDVNQLSRDDWDLTAGEFRSQRVQLLLQLEVNTAVLGMINARLKAFPEKKKVIDYGNKE